MSDIATIVLVITGIIALVAAVRGSVRRDAAWDARFRAATTDEDRQRLMVEKPRNSILWLASHVTTRWGLAIYGVAAIAIALHQWIQR